MEDYPRRIYLAASWRGLTEGLTTRVAQSLADRGLTLLGDHSVHREQETGRDLQWQQRVDDVMMDCGGLVAVLPPDDTPQTTSPFILPEIMIAARQQLPILLVHPPGVNVELTQSTHERVLWLPTAINRTTAEVAVSGFPWMEPASAEVLAREETFSDDQLRDIRGIDLSGSPVVVGPTKYEGEAHEHALGSAITTFVDSLRDRPSKYVFHIVPFARLPLHQRVAAAVFEETGLPCLIASDNWRSPAPARQHWRQLLSGSEMVVADLSESNRNCLFEAGAAAGMNKPVQLVRGGSGRKKIEIPFGLDDHLQAHYESERELIDVIRRFCLPYKRTVFNLTKLAQKSGRLPGVPGWYSVETRSGLGTWTVRLQAILCIVVFALLCAVAVYRVSPQYLTAFAALVGGPVIVLTLIARFLESAKADLNDWFVARAKAIRNIAIILVIVAAAAVVSTWIFSPKETVTSDAAQQGDAVDRPPAGN